MSKHGTDADGTVEMLVGRDRLAREEMASGLMTVVSMVSGKLIPVERGKGDR